MVPPSMLPPSEVTWASQSPPWLPAMIVLRACSGFGCGGMLGTKSDSTTERPPPVGAELRQIVTLAILKAASASWNIPPPETLALLLEIVLQESFLVKGRLVGNLCRGNHLASHLLNCVIESLFHHLQGRSSSLDLGIALFEPAG